MGELSAAGKTQSKLFYIGKCSFSEDYALQYLLAFINLLKKKIMYSLRKTFSYLEDSLFYSVFYSTLIWALCFVAAVEIPAFRFKRVPTCLSFLLLLQSHSSWQHVLHGMPKYSSLISQIFGPWSFMQRKCSSTKMYVKTKM